MPMGTATGKLTCAVCNSNSLTSTCKFQHLCLKASGAGKGSGRLTAPLLDQPPVQIRKTSHAETGSPNPSVLWQVQAAKARHARPREAAGKIRLPSQPLKSEMCWQRHTQLLQHTFDNLLQLNKHGCLPPGIPPLTAQAPRSCGA